MKERVDLTLCGGRGVRKDGTEAMEEAMEVVVVVGDGGSEDGGEKKRRPWFVTPSTPRCPMNHHDSSHNSPKLACTYLNKEKLFATTYYKLLQCLSTHCSIAMMLALNSPVSRSPTASCAFAAPKSPQLHSLRQWLL
jgi:hypothetical protein